jgi:putative copper export protein
MGFALWKFLHIVAMALWFGGMAALGIWTGRARRSGDPRIVAFAYSTAGRFYRGMVTGVALLSVFSGAMLMVVTNRPWFRPLPEHWLFQMQIVGITALLLTLFYVVPNARAIGSQAQSVAEGGEDAPEFARRVKRQVIVGNVVGLLLLYQVLLGSFRF